MARYRLGSICQIISGSTPKTGVQEYWNGDKKWITPAELSESDYIIYDTERKLTEAGVRAAGLTLLPKGTVILSSRAPIGKVAIAGCEMYCNQGFKNFVCSDIINNKYLYWYLRRKTDFLNSLGRGATFKEISKSTVADIELDIPELSEQSKRVAHFEKLQSIITSRRIQLAKLDELVKCRFVELFGDPVCNNKNWEKVPLFQCLESIDSGKSFICQTNPRNGAWPALLKLSAVTYGVFRPNENKAVIDRNHFVSSDEVKKGDLLFTRKNTPELVGMCAYVYDTPSMLMMPDLIFRLNTNSTCDKIFLWKLINHDIFRNSIKSIASGSAKSMSNISQERLCALTIIRPPMGLQTSFASFVSRIDKLRFVIQESLDETQKLFDGLMQDYFD